MRMSRILILTSVVTILVGCASRLPQLPMQEHWSRGSEAYYASDYRKAIRHFNAITRNSAAPADLAAAALFFTGDAYRKAQNDKKAAEAFGRLTREYPMSSYARLVYRNNLLDGE